MGFLTPVLLGGVALVALPVLLHLVMRRQPRKLAFPALQFVRRRQQANRRRMNLRNWLLLALRCLLVAGLAVALARPTLRRSGLHGKEGAPLAVALVVDNSHRMQYVHENKTRQRQAVEMAEWLVEQFPSDTEIAVVDRSRAATGFVVDKKTAEARLRHLEPEGSPRPLEDAVRGAIQLVTDRPDHRQEVFLFSDLSAVDWTKQALKSIKEVLDKSPDVRIFVVDVGVTHPRNISLGQLKLRSSILRPGQPLHMDVSVRCIGSDEAQLVELFLEGSSTEAVKRGQHHVELTASPAGSNLTTTGQATFELADLPLGIHQGYVRLAADDPLEVDNTRYFTVDVRPPVRVLLLGENRRDTLFLREALSPSMGGLHVVRFECEAKQFSEAVSLALKPYAVVCLCDPPPLDDKLWQALADYTHSGGGTGIFLGHRARMSAFNEPVAEQLLPGKLKIQSRQATHLRPRSLAHPALSSIKDYAASIPWEIYPVWKYWELGDLATDAYVVMRFANNQPAILERPLGRGRVVTLTTPVSDPLEPPGRKTWNLLPTGPEPWPFVALSNQIVGYLAQHDNASFTFSSGETVVLQLATLQPPSIYVLVPPDGEPMRRKLPPGENTIRISTTRSLGNYKLTSGGTLTQVNLGFSVNGGEDQSRLERIDPTQLASAFPANRVQLAETLEDIEIYVDVGRSGHELFSWAITLVALVWSTEHLLANRFYRSTK
ncbi:MAG: BatA domain-containing protein [Pirellulales bacterium]|nr:BatA domain-containing protein [Pirellulales bacterium]